MTHQRNTPVTVVLIESLSYTGTTWINLVLGSNPDALAIGPLDRVVSEIDPETVCRVHGKDCNFWPKFLASRDSQNNFFVELADFSKKHTIIINNPSAKAFKDHFDHPDIWIKRIRVLRDARGIFASWLRVHPDAQQFRNSDSLVQSGAIESFAPMIHREFSRLNLHDSTILVCRYEDVLAHPKILLERFGKFIGVQYDESSLRYWEHDIHPTAGNQGTISMIKFHQNIPVPKGYRDGTFYREQYERVRKGISFKSDSWKVNLEPDAIFAIELACLDYQCTLRYRDFAEPDQRRAEFEKSLASSRIGASKLLKENLLRKQSGEIFEPGSALSKGVMEASMYDTAKAIYYRLPAPLKLVVKKAWKKLRRSQ